MHLIDRIIEKIEKESMSVLKMSKETEIPAYRIYKWIDGKGKPKSEDTGKLEKWLNGSLDIIPNREVKIVSNPNDPAYLAGQLSMVERLITKLEKENKTIQAEKEILLKTLDKAQDAIIKALEPIKEYTGKILSNSETILVDLQDMSRMTRADDATIMRGTDKILEREDGESAKEAHTLERAFGEDVEEIDMKDNESMPGKKGRLKKQ